MANLFQKLINRNSVPTEQELDILVYGNQPKINTNSQEYLENMGIVEPKQTMGNRLADALLGKQLPVNDTIGIATDENGNQLINSTVNQNPRQGGFLRDLAEGYKENRNQNFSLDNWGQGDKNVATRIGEGLGSIAKFAESPAGRALLTGAAVGLTGGTGLQALAFGGMAGAGNQSYRLADQMYRGDLNNQDIDTTGYKGYIDSNMYQNMLRSKQLQDNAAYRQMYYDTMLQNHADDLEFKRQQAELQRQEKAIERAERRAENAANRAVTMRGQDLNYNLAQDKLNGSKEDLTDVQNQLDNFTSTFKSLPSKGESYTLGALRQVTGMQTQKEANFNAQRTLLFNQIARKLGGEKGVLSDQDIKRIENALPKLTDSYDQKIAKMKAVYDLLDIKKGTFKGTQQVGKYKVTVK